MTDLERQFLEAKRDGLIPKTTGWSEWKNAMEDAAMELLETEFPTTEDIFPTECLGCGERLSTSRNSTSSYRTDGYCSAACKRKNRGRA